MCKVALILLIRFKKTIVFLTRSAFYRVIC
nr:MAG TPA: hypothetical protein [Caudoviricetes sp.]